MEKKFHEQLQGIYCISTEKCHCYYQSYLNLVDQLKYSLAKDHTLWILYTIQSQL